MPNCPRCQAELPPQGASCPRCGGDARWWSTRGGQVFGPYDLATMQFCRQDGRVVDDDLVKVGDGPWLRAGDVLPGPGAPFPVPSAPKPATTAPAPPARTSKRVYWVMGVLVVVSALLAIAVMAAILYPVFARARSRAQTTGCVSHLKQVSAALQMYCQDNGGKLPPTTDWPAATAAFLPQAGDAWKCPGYSPPRAYVENDQLCGQLLPRATAAPAPNLAWCPPAMTGGTGGPHQGGRNVLMADGAVKWMDARDRIGTPPKQ